MKTSKINKKIVSMIAVLAVSATAVSGAVAYTATKSGSENSTVSDFLKTNKISTALGETESVSSGKVYYVTPDATATGTGASWSDPIAIYKVLGNTTGIVSPLQPGDTVYVQPGIYNWDNNWSTPTTGLVMTASGTYNSYIRIVNAALDPSSGYTGTDKEAIISFYGQNFASNARGVQIYGDYVYWYGIDICGAGDNGMYIGGSYNTVEYCDFYNNRDTGLQLGRAYSEYTAIDDWPNYNLVKNCTSHNNYDNETYGENADGFAAKLTVGYGNVFDGCIAYRNSDDGWDLYAKSDSGNIGQVIIYNCVAFENGYLEYTQQECNKLYPTWSGLYSEADDKTGENLYGLNSYKTRDGDGNGFKLGGSVMEGDVVMYNCLSFNNRMHGVTDNSNPGVLSVNYTTSYNNGGVVDNDPASAYFGYIRDLSDSENTYGNIDVSRQTYSYNNLSHVLAVKDELAKALESDAYRASVTDSILGGYKVEGSLDADSKLGVKGTAFEAPASSAVFTTLPFVKTETDGVASYAYNMTGLSDTYADSTFTTLSSDRVHLKYRNEDGSINMGDILAVKDYSELLGEDNKVGSILNLGTYDAYTHFFANDLAGSGATSENASKVARAKETLQINCNPVAVYQDFDVPSKLTDCALTWTSSDDSVLIVGTDKDVSISKSEYIMIAVYRPLEEDVTVQLTATITCGNVTDTKVFDVTVKAGTPTIGDIQIVNGLGEVFGDGATINLIIDEYSIYHEPTVQVTNGIDYNNKLLDESLYTVSTKYMYAADTNSAPVEIKGFTPSKAGVYTITHTVKMNGEEKSMTYRIFVASESANVDFDGGATVSVYRDGYIIAGSMSSATGVLYTLASDTALDLTDAELQAKVLSEGTPYSFRAQSISATFDNANSGEYYIYYLLSNLDGAVTSEVYCQPISVVKISTPEQFMTVAGGSSLNGENAGTTIYQLEGDLDFDGVSYTVGKNSFKGLLNGMGYTVKNVTIDKSGTNNIGIFYKVTGGTIENIKFDNIKLTGAQAVAIVSGCYGGYFYNIAITNISVTGSQRAAALIGRSYEGDIPTYIDQVSVVNEIPEVNADGTISDANAYIIQATSNRAAGIIGLIQSNESMTADYAAYISNCFVKSYIVCGTYTASSIVGEYQDSYGSGYGKALEISYCISESVIVSLGSSSRLGGIVGYQTGTTAMLISNCVSIGSFYYSGVKVTASQKNLSGIIGNFNLAAGTVLTDCASLMEEYNTDYQEGVTVYTPTAITRAALYKTILGFDTDNLWTLLFEEDSTTILKDPYITLNFLGDWTNVNEGEEA